MSGAPTLGQMVNKCDNDSPNVRCRIVAKDFSIDKRPDLFAATPPLEYLRYLVSRCASSQLGPNKTKLMLQDVKKAYFYAPATRDVYVELQPERAQLGMCAKSTSLFMGRDTPPLTGRRRIPRSCSAWVSPKAFSCHARSSTRRGASALLSIETTFCRKAQARVWRQCTRSCGFRLH